MIHRNYCFTEHYNRITEKFDGFSFPPNPVGKIMNEKLKKFLNILERQTICIFQIIETNATDILRDIGLRNTLRTAVWFRYVIESFQIII